MPSFHQAMEFVIWAFRLPGSSAMAAVMVKLMLRVALAPLQVPFSASVLQRLSARGQSGVAVKVGVGE